MNWKLYSEDKPPLSVDVMIVTLHDPQMTWEGQFKDEVTFISKEASMSDQCKHDNHPLTRHESVCFKYNHREIHQNEFKEVYWQIYPFI